MRVKRYLLLLAASWVHVAVGMKVTTLGVPVTERHTAPIGDVCWHSLHSLRIQSSLELGRHEAVALARVNKADEVDAEHGHVE